MAIGGPWPPLPPVGDDPPWGLPPFSFGPEDPNVAAQDLVTRQMCASVHLDGKFANTVAGELLSVPHRSVWPIWHVDLVLLARQAKFSRERRMLRDIGLCLSMLVMLFGWALLLVAVLVDRMSPWPALFGAVAIGLVVYVGAYLQVWYFYDQMVDIVFEIMEQPVISLERLDAWSGYPWAGWPPTDAGVAQSVARVMHRFNLWFMALRQQVRASYRALWKRHPQDERSTQDGWDFIDSLERSNVVLFNRSMRPFELAGVPLDTFTLTVDLTKYTNGSSGAPTLSASRLHHKLLEEVPDGSLPHVRADSLLVASGMQPGELGLFPPWRRGKPDPENDPLLEGRSGEPPDPRSKAGEEVNRDGWYLEHPDSRVGPETIEATLEGPPEGARVYAYFQKYSWRGHVVVCAAVRVYRALNTLYIEFDAHALPPLSDGFNNMYGLPEGARNRRMALGRTVMSQTPGLLFQSMRALFSMYFTHSGRLTVTRELQAAREEEARIDYGARINLRLAAGNPDALWRFPYVDELDYARVLRDRTLDVIDRYLTAFGVPMAGFRSQVQLMRERNARYDVQPPDR